MRLLNAKSQRLESFFDKEIPKYAILSHTWGADEVAFQDFNKSRILRRKSRKIQGCCAQAIADKLEYVWIDTCCIDKSSSTELSEAINSMFAWYEKAVVCYVYLADVPTQTEEQHREQDSSFRKSRWFTRGWTLQELLAPATVKFYDSAWTFIGDVVKNPYFLPRLDCNPRHDFPAQLVSEITGIPFRYVMQEVPLSHACIALKMSWAAYRQTTRLEDMAYCLLGLFNVSMPLLYGEGRKAFVRLQGEIIKEDDDESIFTFDYLIELPETFNQEASYLANSPADFAGCNADETIQVTRPSARLSHYTITNKGLHISMQILKLVTGDYIGKLCSVTSRNDFVIAIPLVKVPGSQHTFFRPAPQSPVLLHAHFFSNIDTSNIYISKSQQIFDMSSIRILLGLKFKAMIDVIAAYPVHWSLIGGWALTEFGSRRRWGQDCLNQTFYLECKPKGYPPAARFVLRVECKFANSRYCYRPLSAVMSLQSLPEDYDSLLEFLIGGGASDEQEAKWIMNADFDLNAHWKYNDGSLWKLKLDTAKDNKKTTWNIDIVNYELQPHTSAGAQISP